MAQVYKRGEKWRAQVRVTGHKAESKTFRTKTEAKSWGLQRETELRQGRVGLSAMTFGELVDKYVAEVSHTKRPTTVMWERKKAKFLRRYALLSTPLSALSPNVFGMWRDERLAEVSASSVNRELNFLSAIMSHAAREWELVDSNCLRNVKRPRNPPPRNRRISNTETLQVTAGLGYREELPVQSSSQVVAVAWLIAIETGMRRSELFLLEWSRVSLDQRFVSLPLTKNHGRRDVPLSVRAVQLFEKLLGIDSAMVFNVSPDVATALSSRAIRKAGIADLTFHDTRHEAVTRLARKLDVLDLARMIGHRDIKSLMIYYNATATEIAHRLD